MTRSISNLHSSAVNVLIYTHVEKTGGSSFVVGLRQIFGADRVYDIRGGHPRPVDMTPKDLGKMWVFSGHFWFDTQERPIGRRISTTS